MQIPPRILRAEAESLEPALFERTPRQQARHGRILNIARALMARHGYANITFSALAIALNLGRDTLRRQICDQHALLGEILRKHLQAIARALGAVPWDAPDRHKQRRAAYLAFTRTPMGGFTDAHLLLVRDRNLLPDDVRVPIEQLRASIGQILANTHGEPALALLDTETIDPAAAEAALAALLPPQPPAQTEPPPTPQPVPAAAPADASPQDWFDTGPEKPGDWIYNVGIPGLTAPPLPVPQPA
jgi:AcrR family transcriptional regulator